MHSAAVGFVQLAQSFGICCAKICATFPLDKICKVWYNGDFAAHQTCAARHYITKFIFCQVKISKKSKKISVRFYGHWLPKGVRFYGHIPPTKKVSAFSDTNLQKKVSLFMDTFFYHSFLFVNTLWKVWALRPQSTLHFFMLLKAIR